MATGPLVQRPAGARRTDRPRTDVRQQTNNNRQHSHYESLNNALIWRARIGGEDTGMRTEEQAAAAAATRMPSARRADDSAAAATSLSAHSLATQDMTRVQTRWQHGIGKQP